MWNLNRVASTHLMNTSRLKPFLVCDTSAINPELEMTLTDAAKAVIKC